MSQYILIAESEDAGEFYIGPILEERGQKLWEELEAEGHEVGLRELVPVRKGRALLRADSERGEPK